MCLEARPCAGVRLSKIVYYLVDNVSCSMLSNLKHRVNNKERGGTRARQTFPGLEDRETGASSIGINFGMPWLQRQLALRSPQCECNGLLTPVIGVEKPQQRYKDYPQASSILAKHLFAA